MKFIIQRKPLFGLCLALFLLPGCSINPYSEAPPEGYKEVRCTYIDGEGRYGLPFTNYVKGKVKMVKLTLYGDIDFKGECSSDGGGEVEIIIGDRKEKEKAAWGSLDSDVTVFEVIE